MKYHPKKYRRWSIRLKGYDYTRNGAYFVTVCTQDRNCLFGEVVDGVMRLNAAGEMVQRWWEELPRKFPSTRPDTLGVMPNHIHQIIVIAAAAQPVGADLCVRLCVDGAPADLCAHIGAPLPAIVRWFKTMATNEYIRGVRQSAWPAFAGRLWQRNYYEHIIRNEESLNRIRQYILDNPAQWAFDRENPLATEPEPESVWQT